MKRASYRQAVEWISQHASPGDPGSDDPDTVAYLVSVLLIADIFDVAVQRVARDVVRRRERMDGG